MFSLKVRWLNLTFNLWLIIVEKMGGKDVKAENSQQHQGSGKGICYEVDPDLCMSSVAMKFYVPSEPDKKKTKAEGKPFSHMFAKPALLSILIENRKYRKRKQEVAFKNEVEICTTQAENHALRELISKITLDVSALQAERASLQDVIALANARLDLAYKQIAELTDDLTKRTAQLHVSDQCASEAVRKVERQLSKAIKRCEAAECLAAEKRYLAEEKEKHNREREACLTEKLEAVKMERRAARKKLMELKRLQEVVMMKEEKLDALLQGESNEDEQSEEEMDAPAVLQIDDPVEFCKGVFNTEALGRVDTSSFPPSSKFSVVVSADGVVDLRCRSLSCDGSVEGSRTTCKPCSITQRNLLTRKSSNLVSDENKFDGEEVLDDCLGSLSLQDRKTVALKVYIAGERKGMLKQDASELASDVVSVSDRTVRSWRKDWVANGGLHFTPSARGMHSKIDSPFDDVVITARAKEWVKAHTVVKGQGNMTAESFLKFCNEELLIDWLKDHNRRPFSIETARSWLHKKLGFSVYTHKKGLYKDGHDNPDVIKYRKEFVREMQNFDDRHAVALPVYDVNGLPVDKYEGVVDEIATLIQTQRAISISKTPARIKRFVHVDFPGLGHDFPHPYLKCIPGILLTESRPVLYLYEDESICHTNQSENQFWGETGETPVLKPKTEGKGIMVADFVLSIGKFVEFLTDDDWKRAERIRPGIARDAAVYFEYGKDKGYYTSDDFLPHVEIALWIFHFSFPTIRLIGFFDQSGVHWRYADDALNASRLNLRKPGKALLRDTSFVDKHGRRVQQKLAYFDEEEQEEMSKTLQQVLEERGLWVDGTSKDEAVALLQIQPDFASEECLLQKLFQSYGDICRPLPVCHPELDYLELVWAAQKAFIRSQGKTGIVHLRENVREARSHCKVDPLFLLHCFRKSRDFLHCYTLLQDISGHDALECVQKYKSHRRVFEKQLTNLRKSLPGN
jgi:hypothetical protein